MSFNVPWNRSFLPVTLHATHKPGAARSIGFAPPMPTARSFPTTTFTWSSFATTPYPCVPATKKTTRRWCYSLSRATHLPTSRSIFPNSTKPLQVSSASWSTTAPTRVNAALLLQLTRNKRVTHFAGFYKPTKAPPIEGLREISRWTNTGREKSLPHRGSDYLVTVPSPFPPAFNIPKMKWELCVLAVTFRIYPPPRLATSQSTTLSVKRVPFPTVP